MALEDFLLGLYSDNKVSDMNRGEKEQTFQFLELVSTFVSELVVKIALFSFF